MIAGAVSGRAERMAFASRAIVFLILWLIIMGPDLKDVPVGLVAASAAAWTSLYLWPYGAGFSFVGVVRFVLRFLPQSVVAGLGVAQLAIFSKRLTPGFTSYKTHVQPGMGRRAFCAVMSLQPGKLPVGEGDDGVLLIHCLNGTESAAEEIAADERACLSVLPKEARHG